MNQLEKLRQYLKAALVASGLPERMVSVHQQAAPDMQRGGVYGIVNVLETKWTAVHERSKAQGKVRHRHWQGECKIALSLSAKGQPEVEQLAQNVLLYMQQNVLLDGENVIPVPSGMVRIAHTDPEGYLLPNNALQVLLEADLSIYHDVELVPIEIELLLRIDGGNPNE